MTDHSRDPAEPDRRAHPGRRERPADRLVHGRRSGTARRARRSARPATRPTSRSRRLPAQLAAYFAGDLKAFDLPLAPAGTPFQRRVWAALQAIPYGRTWSYGELARRVGSAGRAVGLANGKNPIALIIPCHRVIGSDGSLTGYGGGLDRKRYLLLEASWPRRT